MVWDGDCDFCRFWVTKLAHLSGDALEFIEYQAPRITEVAPEIPRRQFEQAVQLILPDGRVFTGAEAISFALKEYGQVMWPHFLYQRLPGAGGSAEAAYGFIASHRVFFSRLTRFAWGRDASPSTHVQVSYIFIRLLALIYLVAFASLSSQIIGLAGENGISPAEQFMSQAETYFDQNQLGLSRYFSLPTLCWIAASDGFLRALNIAGIIVAALLLVGAAPRICLVLLWLIYLSLATVCGVFLQFQWDALLLETGFLAIFLAPGSWWSWPGKGRQPCALALWLLRWLLFRLMFQSACVKLASSDPLWTNLTALQVHFETQLLPTWIAWYVHQLPAWALKGSCALMFAIEMAVPFLMFCPRRLRRWSFWPLVILQITILLTGNYCFFNWLTIALCVLLLDDAALPRFLRNKDHSIRAVKRHPAWSIPLLALAALIAVLTFAQLLSMFKVRGVWSRPVVALYEAVAPFRSINSYGLFAVMTSARPEIIVEGSHDGKEWKAYRFKYKPQELDRRPAFVAPHQPRLDWQMWFAALGSYRENPWLVNFSVRLLQGKREVLDLLESNPFPEAPPKFVRAVRYDYRFTRFTNELVPTYWWRRQFQSEYLPPISLRAN
jgi:lipase maturation factor 1